MSRFLHSIIATAQSPSVSVHPVVPSLFSGSVLHDGSEDTRGGATGTPFGRDVMVVPAAERYAFNPTARNPTSRRSAAAAVGEESRDAARTRVDAQSEQTARQLTQSIAPFSNVSGNRAGNFASAADRFERTALAPAASEGSSDAAPNRVDAQRGQIKGPLTQSIAPFSNVMGDRARNLASAADRFERTAPAAGTWNSGLEPVLRESFGNGLGSSEAVGTAAGRYSPLVPEGLPRRSGPQALEPLTAHAMMPMQRADETAGNGRLAHHLRPPSHEADEIQIHIGRIEVTAVPPVPARPAPVPNRKSPSLDEYLKRRPGRAG
jgi:hypothetical protein